MSTTEIEPGTRVGPPTKTRVRRRNRAKATRADIQGLRAVAVVLVVLDHLLHWPNGGFIGVDVFFVISGFLITGLLLRERDQTGRISFSGFYRRRIRRIIPAAALVLVGTVAAGFLFLNTGFARQTLWDSVWAALMSANWHFALIGTDYFTAGDALSPIQHYWSLAVEEQFYFIWPWIIVAVLAVTARKAGPGGTTGRRAVGFTMAALVVGSFLWAVVETGNEPTVAYFSTFSRAWELGVGALVAVSAGVCTRIPDSARRILSWTGLAGILASAFMIDGSVGFPAPFAALPVASTALVIVAGTGGPVRAPWLLTNSVAGYLGNVSYSLYLWHFPVIIFLTALLPDPSPSRYLAAVGVIGFLTVLTYELVEQPVRRSSWLTGKKVAERLTRQERESRHQQNKRIHAVALSGLLVLTLAIVSAAVIKNGREVPGVVSVIAEPAGASSEEKVGGAPELLTPFDQTLVDSLALQQWPEMTPSLEELAASKSPEWVTDDCLDTAEDTLVRCTYGNGEKLAVLLGDSVGISYLPGLRAALEGNGWRIQVLTMTECPAIFVSVLQRDAPHTACDAHHKWVEEVLAAQAPDLIIVSSALNSLLRLASRAQEGGAISEWTDATQDTLARIAPLAAETVILAPPPEGKRILSCATQFNGPSDCSSAIGSVWRSVSDAESFVAAQTSTPEARVTYVDTSRWFCTQPGSCPALFGNVPIRVDANHLTGQFSRLLGPQMQAALGRHGG
jgi:peptidoglycan/LPS O-acetylase OafA/YrhL